MLQMEPIICGVVMGLVQSRYSLSRAPIVLSTYGWKIMEDYYGYFPKWKESIDKN